MKKYILTKTDGDFPVGSTMYVDGNEAYIEYAGANHPVGYDIESIMYKGEPRRVIGFRWSFLKGYGYEAKEV